MPADRAPSKAQLEPLPAETTVELLRLAKGGDQEAHDRLLQRCVPRLRRWARGRLPRSARDLLETSDLVQDAVIDAMGRLEAFESRHQGALQAYLRQAVINRIRDVLRRQQQPGRRADLLEDLKDEGTSPLEQAIGLENAARYEEALNRLRPADREAIIGRVELQQSYEELATVLDQPTPDAARVAVTRALKCLAQEMRHG